MKIMPQCNKMLMNLKISLSIFRQKCLFFAFLSILGKIWPRYFCARFTRALWCSVVYNLFSHACFWSFRETMQQQECTTKEPFYSHPTQNCWRRIWPSWIDWRKNYMGPKGMAWLELSAKSQKRSDQERWVGVGQTKTCKLQLSGLRRW